MLLRRFTALTLVLWLSLPSIAQNPDTNKVQAQDAQDVTIRAFTKLVEVPVVVTDGNVAVKGLKKEDFTLLENGKPVPIEVFEEISAESSAAAVVAAEKATSSAAPGRYSNFKEGKPEHRAVIILVLDAINTPFFEQAQNRKQLIKFLSEKVQAGSLLSLFVMGRSGLQVIHEYTTDPKILIAALKRAKGTVGAASQADVNAAAQAQMPVVYSADDAAKVQQEAAKLEGFFNNQDEFSSLQQGISFDLTLNALRSLAQTYAGVPGRKALVWAAANFPHFRDDPKKPVSTDVTSKYYKTMDELGDAGISVYPIDARGLIGYEGPARASTVNPGGAMVGPRRDPGVLGGMGDTDLGRINENPQVIDRMKDLAEVTGGVPYYGTNDIAGAIRKASNDSANYYLLGYYLRGGAEQTGIDRRVLKVQVRRGGVKVRSRQRAYITPQNTDPRRDLIMAQITPLEFTNLPLQVKFDPKQKGNGAVPFAIEIGAGGIELQGGDNQVNLDVVAVARTPDGQLVDMVNQKLTGKIHDVNAFRQKPFAYDNRLRLPEGPATVRFIVRDNNSGKMGSVIVEVQ